MTSQNTVLQSSDTAAFPNAAMPSSRRLVFLSWSGEESRKVAEALHRWLPHLIQLVEPWMSSTDILAGARWQTEIASRLNECAFGIICVTPGNVESPWMLFEAGALSKTIAASKVCPFLLGVRMHQLPQALAQFQAVEADERGILSLLHSLNDSLGMDKLTAVQLDKAFAKFYEDIETDLAEVREDVATQRETRFHIYQTQVERTRAIVSDLEALKKSARPGFESIYVRYSGFLSPFAISDNEIRLNAKCKHEYYDGLRIERDRMIELASDERFVLRCIVTPPTMFHVPALMLEYTEMRLHQLKAFLAGEGKTLNIDWAISPFQQKNTYIIGGISCFEGFKQGAEEGYRFTLRYAGPEEIQINTRMYDELYRKLASSTLMNYPSGVQLEERDGLREATLKCVSDAIEEIAKHRDDNKSNSPSALAKRGRPQARSPRKRR